jgi:thymidylate synthase
MNNLDKQYTDLLQDILDNGVQKGDRTGTGTISVFGRQIRHKMSDGFPLLTTKKMPFKTIVTELLWFLRGDTNIKYLVDNNCHIWDGDAYKNYCEQQSRQLIKGCTYQEFINKIKTDDEFAKKWGDLGPVYGKQWRRWTKFEDESIEHNEWYISSESIDQIATLINDLKTNPDSRRLMVNAWNVGEIDQMVLQPCHYGFQVYTRELSLDERAKLHPTPDMFYDINGTFSIQYSIEDSNLPTEDKVWLHSKFDEGGIPKRAISLMWNQRSVDTFLGLPFNIASYGLLLEIIAKEVNMVPDELIGNLGDVHLYSNHIEQAKEQIGRLSWEERKEFLSKEQLITFGDISPFTDKMMHWWLDCSNIPYSKRMPYSLPKLWINDLRSDSNSIINDITKWSHEDFKLENYQSHPAIKAPLSN